MEDVFIPLRKFGEPKTINIQTCSLGQLVAFPDPAFTKDKGLAHSAQNLGLLDLVLEDISLGES